MHHLSLKPCGTSCRFLTSLFLTLTFSVLTFNRLAAQQDDNSVSALKKLSMEELLSLEVTSVSKRPEKLAGVASAVQVITKEEIHRSGATSIPEALRLASNLQVAQLNSHHWIISARGFNSTFSNKLLVMIDGRTVYSPLFAGVFWDVQNVILEDVDRIEVISGPGGTLWGANAVNGVINIITKKASEVKGGYASVSVGNSLRDLVEARYAGNVRNKFAYRVYGQHRDRDHTFLSADNPNNDKWHLTQGGFNLEWLPSATNNITVQGNLYGGLEQTEPNASSVDGQNVLARWAHSFSNNSELLVQTYFDRTWRHDVPGTISDQLNTYDVDLQHRFTWASHITVWGLGYRFMNDHTINSTTFVGLLPPDRKMDLFSSFLQDEMALFNDHLKLIVGSKFQHNSFTGFEIQPSVRFAYTLNEPHTIWGAISRAVRMPSRLDVDYFLPVYPLPDNVPHVAGGPNFKSEKVVSFELGYRIQTSTKWNASLALFENLYDDLYSVEPLSGTQIYQIQNGAKGRTHGLEFSGNLQATSWWRLRGGYTFFFKHLERKPSNETDPATLTNLGSDAKHLILLQSIVNLPLGFQFDFVYRYVDELPSTQFNPRVPSYSALDARLGWQSKPVEISFNAQNIFHNRQPEFAGLEIPSNFYVKGIVRF